jgi:hypothetical protein
MRRDVVRDGCLRNAVMNVETSLAERMLLQVRPSAQSPFPSGVKVTVLAHCSLTLRLDLTGANLKSLRRSLH